MTRPTLTLVAIACLSGLTGPLHAEETADRKVAAGSVLYQRYGWPLPRTQLARYIDGRFDPGAHGTREMPVWGERLEELPPQITGEREKATVIELILDFLESIQGRAET